MTAPPATTTTTPIVLTRGKVFALWLLALPVMLIAIGSPEVSRTQEARVLVVATQMLGHPAIDWIIPKLNGDVRLQKPPLPYWMACCWRSESAA